MVILTIHVVSKKSNKQLYLYIFSINSCKDLKKTFRKHFIFNLFIHDKIACTISFTRNV